MAVGKRFCFWSIFGFVVLFFVGYLAFCGWWIPIKSGRHRLRHNQLVPFQIYGIDTADWFRYNMNTQKMQIVSYSQQREWKYEYLIGTPTRNLSNSSWTTVSWTEFVDLIHSESALFLIEYSSAKCLSLSECREQYAVDHQFDGHLTVSVLSEIQSISLNSELTSKLLDVPRDTFQGVITLVMCCWLILCILYFDEVDFEENMEKWQYLVVAIAASLLYLLYVFSLTVIPIFCSTPILSDDSLNSESLSYWTEYSHSVTFVVGEYPASWWVSGVVIHGIWTWCALIPLPFCALIYAISMVLCCCNKERALSVSTSLMSPILCFGSLGVVISMIAFLTLFVGNLTLWNTATFPAFRFDGDDANNLMLYILGGIMVLIVVIPILGAVVMAFNRSVPRLQSGGVSVHSLRLKAVESAKKGFAGNAKAAANGYDAVHIEMTQNDQ